MDVRESYLSQLSDERREAVRQLLDVMAAQKAHIAMYHFGLYADAALLDWFTAAYAERVKTKLNRGNRGLRFAKPEHTLSRSSVN